MPEGELVYAVIPTPRAKRTRHELASNMDCLPAAYELMARFGFRWQLYCKIMDTVPSRTQPAPGKFVWNDKNIGLGRAYGIKTLPCLWPTRVPKWMVDTDRMRPARRDVVRKSNRGPGFPSYPKLDAWREHCRAVADHYKDLVDIWCIEDETEMYYSARDFAPIVRGTAMGFRAVRPRAIKIALSCMPEYTEELLNIR